MKAAAGGGGRGMKVAQTAEDLMMALSTASNEAKSAFGDASVYLEKYLQKPRHIEIQILGDGRGGAIHLGERDCSLQRRHQKVWEEGPSPVLSAAARAKIGATCAKAMQDMKYLGVGTIEFLYEDGEFYFIEMNTRIQVEHPVTEMITDIDLVLEQIRIAAGGDLPAKQDEIEIIGHAIECRINAENPQTFRPSPGRITQYHPPGGLGVRIDSAVYQGYVIPPYYDSLVGKLIVHGKTRGECLMRLRRALDEMVVEGIETTLPLFRALVREPGIIDGDYHIHWLEQYLAGQPRDRPEPAAKNSPVPWNQSAPDRAFWRTGHSARGALNSAFMTRDFVTPDAARRRAIGQILLLAAGFLVLVAISAASVLLVNKAREDSAPGRAHRRGREPDQCAAAGSPPRRKRRARLSADAGPEFLRPITSKPSPHHHSRRRRG